MSDVATGTLRPDVLEEKVLSAIVEIKVKVEQTQQIIELVREVEKDVDTVVALGVGTRCDENGEERLVAPILERWATSWSAPRPTWGWAKLPTPENKRTSHPARCSAKLDDQYPPSLR